MVVSAFAKKNINVVFDAGTIFSPSFSVESFNLGQDKITLGKLQYGFINGITASGFYASGQWNPISGGNIGNTKLHYKLSTNNSAIISNVNVTLLTGGNTAVRPTGTSADGYLATVTLFFL